MKCPKCNQDPHEHNDSSCIMRYFHDEINEEYGWIDGTLADLIPGEILSDEKAIIHYKSPVNKEDLEKAA